MAETEPGDAVALARLHGVHEPWLSVRRAPGADRKPRRVDGDADGIGKGRLGKAWNFDGAFARQRHPNGGAGLILMVGPQGVVDHADPGAFAHERKFGSP